jgi:hypothetical protein
VKYSRPFLAPEIIDFFVATAEHSSMILDSNHLMLNFFESDQRRRLGTLE